MTTDLSNLEGPVYIAGPMTDIPERNYPLFREVEAILRERGIEDVENPCAPDDHPDDPHPWDWYMRRAISQVIRCRSMILLPGWENSRGATLEHTIARGLYMDIREWRG